MSPPERLNAFLAPSPLSPGGFFVRVISSSYFQPPTDSERIVRGFQARLVSNRDCPTDGSGHVHRFHRQTDATLLVDLEHLDANGLAFRQFVRHIFDALF